MEMSRPLNTIWLLAAITWLQNRSLYFPNYLYRSGYLVWVGDWCVLIIIINSNGVATGEREAWLIGISYPSITILNDYDDVTLDFDRCDSLQAQLNPLLMVVVPLVITQIYLLSVGGCIEINVFTYPMPASQLINLRNYLVNQERRHLQMMIQHIVMQWANHAIT